MSKPFFQAFSLIESEYGVSAFVSPVEMVSEQAIDKLALLSFLAQLKFAITEDEALAAKQRKNIWSIISGLILGLRSANERRY